MRGDMNEEKDRYRHYLHVSFRINCVVMSGPYQKKGVLLYKMLNYYTDLVITI